MLPIPSLGRLPFQGSKDQCDVVQKAESSQEGLRSNCCPCYLHTRSMGKLLHHFDCFFTYKTDTVPISKVVRLK